MSMDLATWLEAEKGRASALAEHLNKTLSAISQWKRNGVPVALMKAVRDFTGGAVSLEEMVPGEGAAPPESRDEESPAAADLAPSPPPDNRTHTGHPVMAPSLIGHGGDLNERKPSVGASERPTTPKER
jgi:hypothetical protein